MKEFNCVPMFHPGLNELTDGILIKASDYCKRNCIGNEKCQQHYQQIFGKTPGNYICPYGFVSRVFQDADGESYIFTGMRLIGFYNSKLADPKVKGTGSQGKEERKTNIKLIEAELQDYVDYYLEYRASVEAHDNLKGFVENIFHDIRKFNAQLKQKSTRLFGKANSGNKGAGQFLELAQNIQSICSFMSLRLNAYDFTYNEELLDSTEPSSYNMHKIFHKAKQCLKDRAEERKLKITLNCDGECGDIRAYDSIELLPYILLDNAIKYADSRSSIKVEIHDSPQRCSFSVFSQSPKLKDGEREKIFNRGFRGENARSVTQEGLGIGLYTAKRICEIHDGTIRVREEYDSQKKVNNFIIDIELKKAYNI